jgi:hypothetical protein
MTRSPQGREFLQAQGGKMLNSARKILLNRPLVRILGLAFPENSNAHR